MLLHGVELAKLRRSHAKGVSNDGDRLHDQVQVKVTNSIVVEEEFHEREIQDQQTPMRLSQERKEEPGEGALALIDQKLGCEAGRTLEEQLNNVMRNNLHIVTSARWQELEDLLEFIVELDAVDSIGHT